MGDGFFSTESEFNTTCLITLDFRKSVIAVTVLGKY